MSIVKKEYKSKKKGIVTKFYAVVSHPSLKSPLWSKGFKTKKMAKEKEDEIRNDIKNGLFPQNDTKEKEVVEYSFKDVGLEWLENCKSDYADATYKNYVYYFNHYVLPLVGEKSIGSIDKYFIEKVKNKLAKKYGAEVVNKCLNIISNVYKYAIKWELTKQNPVLGVQRLKVVLNEVVSWSKNDIKNFLDFKEVRQSEIYDMLLISFLGGLRPSEVCGLLCRSLMKNGIILTCGLNRYGIKTYLKTDGSRRSFELPEDLVKRLSKRIEGREMTDYLFINQFDNPIRPDWYSKLFQRLLVEYNKQKGVKQLEVITLYAATRHSFGTNLVVHDEVSLSVVSKLMGNSEETLRKRYVHVTDSVQKNVLKMYMNEITL